MKLKIPPPFQGLFAAALVWGLDQLFPALSTSFPLQKTLALVLIVVGAGIDLISVFAFFKAKTTINPLSPQATKQLVVSGTFRISRNPMYLGMLLILSGWAIWVGNVTGVLAILLFVNSITYSQIKPEEKVLEEKFGSIYTEYKASVRRWF